jgi:2',3'-cyclic-nucleotide 2'-phosphodiesterase (5'-nucleotidase family)
MKKTETLVKDIYKMMETKDADPNVDVEAEIEKFGEAVKDLMRTEFGREKRQDKRTLRLSTLVAQTVTFGT